MRWKNGEDNIEDLKEVCDVILKIAEGKIVEENENK